MEQMYHRLVVEMCMCAFIYLVLLSSLVRSQTVNCECTVGEDDFAMQCFQNQTCEWNWCRCNSEKSLCNDADSPCSGISCFCYKKSYRDSELWNCTIDFVGNMRCIECGETEAVSAYLKNATVKRTLPPGSQGGVMGEFGKKPVVAIAIRYGNHGSESRVRAKTTAHLLRRGVRCLQALTETCLEDIEEGDCLAVKEPTTVPPPVRDTMCGDSTWPIIGAFVGGFALAILLTIVFLIFYVRRGADATSKATSSTSQQPVQHYNIMERIRTTFRRRNQLPQDMRYVVHTVDEPNSSNNQNGTTVASSTSCHAVQQTIPRREALEDALPDRDNYTRIAPGTDDTGKDATYEELIQIEGAGIPPHELPISQGYLTATGTANSFSADSSVSKQMIRNDDNSVHSNEADDGTDSRSSGVDNQYFILQSL